MCSINQLFKWRQAIDDEDISFVPDNIKNLINKKFIVVNLVENSIVPINTIVKLKDITEGKTNKTRYQHTYNFICNEEEEIFWWCEVYPYKEENE